MTGFQIPIWRAHLQSAIQNLVVLAPFLLSDRLGELRFWGMVLAGYGFLTALSVLHALLLRQPRSRLRGVAFGFAYGLLLGGAFSLEPTFGGIALAYTLLALFNGLLGRRVVVVDVIAISMSVGLKGLGGVALLGETASVWGLICLFMGACTVAMGQRRNEIIHQGHQLRKVLDQYTPKLLDQMLSVVTSSTLVAYALYTLDAGNGQPSESLVYSAFLVNFGLFRYLFLVYRRDMSCGAELAVIRDPQLVGTLALWGTFLFGIHNV